MEELELQNESTFVAKKQSSGLVLSVVFLILVLAISGILYYLNLSKQSDIDTLKKEISSLDNRAKELKNKPEVQIYSLIENNKNTIAELEKRSKITTYMKHLKSIANTTKYGVRFNGFSFSNGTLTTQAIFELDNNSIAYQRARNFIDGYRTDEKALFDLGFISFIEGMDAIKFNVVFKVK